MNVNIKKLKRAVDRNPTLRPRHKEIIYYRFGIEDGVFHTLEETGKLYGVTRERIRQIEHKIFETIGGVDTYLISKLSMKKGGKQPTQND